LVNKRTGEDFFATFFLSESRIRKRIQPTVDDHYIVLRSQRTEYCFFNVCLTYKMSPQHFVMAYIILLNQNKAYLIKYWFIYTKKRIKCEQNTNFVIYVIHVITSVSWSRSLILVRARAQSVIRCCSAAPQTDVQHV
jgi:hypothetical protein